MNSDDVDEAEEMLNDENNDLISLMKDSAVENGDLTTNDDVKDGSNEDFDDVAAIAESLQPKGNTLSSTSVSWRSLLYFNDAHINFDGWF